MNLDNTTNMSNVVIQGFPNNGAYIRSDILGYKSYVALLTQYQSDPIVPIEIENTLGFPVNWTTNSPGSYTALMPITTPLSKFYVSGTGSYGANGNTFIPIADMLSILGYYTMYPNGINGIINGFSFETFNNAWSQVELSSIIGWSDPPPLQNLAGIYIEIRIYN